MSSSTEEAQQQGQTQPQQVQPSSSSGSNSSGGGGRGMFGSLSNAMKKAASATKQAATAAVQQAQQASSAAVPSRQVFSPPPPPSLPSDANIPPPFEREQNNYSYPYGQNIISSSSSSSTPSSAFSTRSRIISRLSRRATRQFGVNQQVKLNSLSTSGGFVKGLSSSSPSSSSSSSSSMRGNNSGAAEITDAPRIGKKWLFASNSSLALASASSTRSLDVSFYVEATTKGDPLLLGGNDPTGTQVAPTESLPSPSSFEGSVLKNDLVFSSPSSESDFVPSVPDKISPSEDVNDDNADKDRLEISNKKSSKSNNEVLNSNPIGSSSSSTCITATNNKRQ
jgi:hypothetical protein